MKFYGPYFVVQETTIDANMGIKKRNLRILPRNHAAKIQKILHVSDTYRKILREFSNCENLRTSNGAVCLSLRHFGVAAV